MLVGFIVLGLVRPSVMRSYVNRWLCTPNGSTFDSVPLLINALGSSLPDLWETASVCQLLHLCFQICLLPVSV